mmetsp:Transcript_25066/g.38619  ORF Transcript_25066/g.38619 Transcript_25066/m.38619 type:complete len:117 (-) Transcript_25066:21-371(-)
MRVHESHLVAVSLYDSNEQVFNVRADGTGTSELLTGGKPQVHADDAASFHNVTGNVLEITEKFTTRSGDLDRARLDLDFDTVGDDNFAGGKNGLHCLFFVLSLSKREWWASSRGHL